MFIDEFSNLRESIAHTTSNLLIVGDFNYHVDEITSDSRARDFMLMIDSFGLDQHVFLPHSCSS